MVLLALQGAHYIGTHTWHHSTYAAHYVMHALQGTVACRPPGGTPKLDRRLDSVLLLCACQWTACLVPACGLHRIWQLQQPLG